jgi:hypothetical protein
MLNRLADLVRLRAYSDLLIQPVGRVASATLRQFEVGTQIEAHVDLARADGTARVIVDGHPLELRLPFNARAGDTLALRVAAVEPQLRFTLAAGADAAAATPSLSETARFITALLAESEKLPVAPAMVAGEPLLDSSTTDSRVIAHVLKSALADSGMFYESHQAQWVADARPLAALMREPQSRFEPLAPQQDTGTVKPDTPQLKDIPVHRDALTVVRQQLETLETRQVVWQGTLWPGQTVEWQVGEERQPPHAAGTAREWQSRVRMTMPYLGEIDATLSLSAHGVRIHLRAATAEGAARLESDRQALRDALTGAGVTPLGIGVIHAG